MTLGYPLSLERCFADRQSNVGHSRLRAGTVNADDGLQIASSVSANHDSDLRVFGSSGFQDLVEFLERNDLLVDLDLAIAIDMNRASNGRRGHGGRRADLRHADVESLFFLA